MKTFALILLTSFTVVFMSCEGDPGPPGPQGPQGPAGDYLIGQAFEIEIDFLESENFEYIESYGFETYPSDVTLVYILWETTNGFDIWRPLPQTSQFDDGTLVYNYDFTDVDVRFFLDGTTDFTALGSAWTQNQVFRVVVVPADFVRDIDTTNLDLVLETARVDTIVKK